MAIQTYLVAHDRGIACGLLTLCFCAPWWCLLLLFPETLQVSAVASEPEALLRRLPLAVTVHLLLLACYQAHEVRDVVSKLNP